MRVVTRWRTSFNIRLHKCVTSKSNYYGPDICVKISPVILVPWLLPSKTSERTVYKRLWKIVQHYYDSEDVHNVMERRVSEYYVERRRDPLCAFIE